MNNEKCKIRISLSKKYINSLNEAWKDLTTDEEMNLYKKAISILNDFITECNYLIENANLEDECELNYRQFGGYQRCVERYPDKGWKERYKQFAQAYKELMCDFLYYDDNNIAYSEITNKEIIIMQKMARFLIDKAEEYLNN